LAVAAPRGHNDYAFTSRLDHAGHLSTRQHARLPARRRARGESRPCVAASPRAPLFNRGWTCRHASPRWRRVGRTDPPDGNPTGP